MRYFISGYNIRASDDDDDGGGDDGDDDDDNRRKMHRWMMCIQCLSFS